MNDFEQSIDANGIPVEHQSDGPYEITMNGIVTAVSQYYDTSAEMLLGKEQEDSAIKDARTIMLTLISDHTPLSHEQIAEVTGRSQGTVSASIRRVRERANVDPRYSQHLQDLAQAAGGKDLTETLASWPRLVAEHYGLSMEEIIAAKTEKATEARQVAAHLLVEKTVLRNGAVARRVGLSASSKVAYAQQRVVERSRSDERFASSLAQLEEGKIPEGLRDEDVLNRVTAYYGISRAELLGKSRKDQYAQPRLMAMHLMVRELGYSYTETGRKFGRGSRIREDVLGFEQRLESDPRLQQQRSEMLDPKTAELEPASHRLMQKVCDFYGVESEAVREERPSNRFMRPREVIAYLMREQIGLSVREVMGHLQRSEPAIIQAHHSLEQKIEDNPLVASEVAYLESAKRITRSINERIILRAAEATGVDPNDILNSKKPEVTYARQLAMVLMAERGHLSPREVAEFFGLTSEAGVYRARTVIEYRQPRDPLLTKQLEWVRQKIFSERPAMFEFNAGAPHELQNDQEILLRSSLPDVDKRLVHPDILKQVYDVVEQVASFYKVPAIEVIGRTDEFLLNRARRMAALLCHESRIPQPETATCFDTRTLKSIKELVKTAEADIEQQSVFAEELAAITSGETRRDVLSETLRSVARFYNISTTELRREDNYRATRGRTVFLLVMAEHACATLKQRGAAIDRSEENAGALTMNAQKRIQSNPRLHAEVQYILNPDNMPPPPAINDILLKICASYGISADTLREPQLADERSAKRMAAYVLADELELPHKEIAEILQAQNSTVASYIRQIKSKLATNPSMHLEIDRLKPQNAASISMAGRIIRLVMKRYEVTLDDIASNDQTRQLNKARAATIDLMVNRAGYSPKQASQILGMSEAVVANLAIQR